MSPTYPRRTSWRGDLLIWLAGRKRRCDRGAVRSDTATASGASRVRLVIALSVAGAATVMLGAILLVMGLAMRVVSRHAAGQVAVLGLALAAAGTAFGLVTLLVFALTRALPAARTRPRGTGGPGGTGDYRTRRRGGQVLSPTGVYSPGGLLGAPRDARAHPPAGAAGRPPWPAGAQAPWPAGAQAPRPGRPPGMAAPGPGRADPSGVRQHGIPEPPRSAADAVPPVGPRPGAARPAPPMPPRERTPPPAAAQWRRDAPPPAAGPDGAVRPRGATPPSAAFPVPGPPPPLRDGWPGRAMPPAAAPRNPPPPPADEAPAQVFVYRDTGEGPDEAAPEPRAAPSGDGDASYWYAPLQEATAAPQQQRRPDSEPEVPHSRGPFEPLLSSAAGAAGDAAEERGAADGREDPARERERKLEQLKDLYLTAEAIGEENVDKHFDKLLARQRALISEYFKQSAAGQAGADVAPEKPRA